MHIAILTSSNFDETNKPLIKKELIKRGHKYKEFCNLKIPINELMNFEVIWDRSAITEDSFFISLEEMLLNYSSPPLMINSPISTMNSYDKIRMHIQIGQYSPLTKVYNGNNIDEIINLFSSEEEVIIKEPRGWHSKGVIKVPTKKLSETLTKTPKVVQKFIEPKNGVYRSLVINYNGIVEPLAWYTRIPKNSWRTGEGSDSYIKQINPEESMKEFIYEIALKSGLFLNGIDYISNNGNHYLLEINSVPRLSTAVTLFGINTPERCIISIEDAISKR